MAHHTRIKICGITTVDDARYAESLGVDAIGFVFVERSKRHIAVAQAQAISAELGAFISCVGLFLDAPSDEVRAVLRAMPGLMPQFHGQESPEYCDSFGCHYIKALGVGAGMPDAQVLSSYTNAKGLLFDSNAVGQLGGTGHTFDWSLLDNTPTQSLILAGGLDDSNVEEAIRRVKPYAVDVSTGVESAPGIKDAQKVARFVKHVREADR